MGGWVGWSVGRLVGKSHFHDPIGALFFVICFICALCINLFNRLSLREVLVLIGLRRIFDTISDLFYVSFVPVISCSG